MSISRGNVPFLGRFPRLIDTFLLTGEDFLLTKLQVGASVEYGKTTNTTFTTCNNLHASRVAILLQGKQQNTTLRQDKMSGNIQGEALFIVVKVVQVVFLYVHVSVPAKRYCKSCSSCFPYSAGRIENNTSAPLTQISDEPSSLMNEELSLYFATNFLPFWI